MPGYDGTGPMGRGPGTGRGIGYCRVARTGFGRFIGRYPRSGMFFNRPGRGLFGGWRRNANVNQPPGDFE